MILRDNAKAIIYGLIFILPPLIGLILYFNGYEFKIVKRETTVVIKEEPITLEPIVVKPIEQPKEVVKEEIKPVVIEESKNTEIKQNIDVKIDLEKIIEKSKTNTYNITINNKYETKKVITENKIQKKDEDKNLQTATNVINEINDLFQDIK